jgi:IS1 family transposase
MLPEAPVYCTDPYAVYPEIIWPHDGSHLVASQKEQTHTIESLNANLRTYLGRLARASRCFSRSLAALRQAVRLFVYHYNLRQRFIRQHPIYKHALPLCF